jgi:hypothetical protein
MEVSHLGQEAHGQDLLLLHLPQLLPEVTFYRMCFPHSFPMALALYSAVTHHKGSSHRALGYEDENCLPALLQEDAAAVLFGVFPLSSLCSSKSLLIPKSRHPKSS